VQRDRHRLRIVNGVRRAGVAVPRLPNAAGVEDHAHVRVEIDFLAVGQAEELTPVERGPVFDDEHRNVRVAHEPEGRLLEREVALGGFGRVEVLPNGPAQRPVHERKAVLMLDLGQRVEKLLVFG